MMQKLLFSLLLLTQALAGQQPAWPEQMPETKPWTRMWWPGSIGTKADITSALGKYKEAGLGGIEVTVIYGVKGQEDKFVNYLSPEWMDKFMHFLEEANRLGLGIDLANASGWPFGGPWVSPGDACRNINYKTYSLKQGQRLEEKVEFIQQPFMRPVGQRPDITKLVEPIGKNKDLQLYALDQIRFEKILPPICLMAYSDSGETVDLTRRINGSNTLDWTAPAGDWTLYALFEGWHGKLAERAGPGGEGDVIDHFSADAIDNFLSHFDSIFKDYDLKYLRGFFNDSYEVDDASGQANWTDDMFMEFEKRRGYDLRLHLPALFQKDQPGKNERVLSDYRQTISDLLLETFTTRWRQWANVQGKVIRNQAHGSPGNILDLYAASDIPETEGYELTRLKFASSASNVTGKKLTSCEAATWLNEHFSSTLGDVKEAADLFFLAGINHLFYHGTCFSPQNEPWPGFQFYAAVEFSPASSFWNDFSALNSYVSNIQSFMQQGKPDNDLLLYFPVFDRYASYGRGMLEHFDAISPAFKGSPFRMAADRLPELGYSYDFISDLQLGRTNVSKNLLKTEDNTYKTLILPGCKYIPLETFEKAISLATDGAHILFYGNMPENVSGWAGNVDKTEKFNRLKASLDFKQAGEHISIAETGSGKIIVGDNLGEMLSFLKIKGEPMSAEGMQFMRRATENGSVYFIKNTGIGMPKAEGFEGWLPFNVHASPAAIFNPATGVSGIAATRFSSEKGFEIFLQLQAGESLIIRTSEEKGTGRPYSFYKPSEKSIKINGSWSLEFIEGGPVKPEPRVLEELISWTETGGDDVKNFSGTASYKTTFRKPKEPADAWILNLTKVNSSARVILNGKEIAVLTGPEFRVVIDDSMLKRKNTLEIKVSNLMANRIAWMDRNKIEWKNFYNINFAARRPENNKNGIFDASGWEPRESGLTGPVLLIPAMEKQP